MKKTIALAGNPNCGKTTLFNLLTASNQYVGNWPGVTVEHKEGRLKSDKEVTITDLPGIYSLSPYTLEEVIARDYLLDKSPDAIIDIIDGTNLERNLYLTTQLLELGIPVVVAVNMMDAVRKSGNSIDAGRLSRELGCPVVEISALKNEEIDRLLSVVAGDMLSLPKIETVFSVKTEHALAEIGDLALSSLPEKKRRWYAIKLFEYDEKVREKLHLDQRVAAQIDAIIESCEKVAEDDSESIIAAGRYDAVEKIVSHSCKRRNLGRLSTSDKIDRVVTNRWLGLPIFVIVMFLVYFISVTTVGTWATDWANDGVFGDGWFIAGGDEYQDANDEYLLAQGEMGAYESAATAAGLDPESDDFLAAAESEGLVTTYDNYDSDSGELETLAVDAAAYGAAREVAEPNPTEYGVWVPGIPALMAEGLVAIGCADWLYDLIISGIVAGVGAVLGFVPQLLILFLLLALLESCGYLSRVAFVLDRVFRRFGLSGKSFIPILIGTGCGVPGIMASRTIENINDRRMTIMTTTFVPCSAKLPIIALIAGAVFGGIWWVAPSAYFLGIAMILCSGIILKKTRAFSGPGTPFVMELPAYHLPTAGVVLRSMGERAWSFIKKAGTIILLACILIWFISSYGVVDGAFGAVEDQNDSILAFLAGSISWIFIPLGWGDWQATGATITGLIAKENVVSTFSILYAGDAGWYANMQAAFLPAAAYSFLAFNLLCAPCFAAMGAIKREMNDARWFWRAIGYECGLAYCVALVIYQIVGLFTGEVVFSVFTGAAVMLVGLFIYLLIRPQKDFTDDDAMVPRGVSEMA